MDKVFKSQTASRGEKNIGFPVVEQLQPQRVKKHGNTNIRRRRRRRRSELRWSEGKDVLQLQVS